MQGNQGRNNIRGRADPGSQGTGTTANPTTSGFRSSDGELAPPQNGSNSYPRPKVRVEGKRKVWGTLRTTTASAVSSTIKSVVKIEGLNVRRKFIRRLSRNPQTS